MTQGDILPSKLLCKEIVKKEKVVGNIIIPETAQSKEPNTTALVEIIGAKVQDLLFPARPICKGDKILFNPHAPQRVRIEGEDFLLVDCKDLLFYSPSSELV